MSSRFTAENVIMLQTFSEKGAESLQQVEDELLRLEASADPGKSLDVIFFQIHTIKGLASFFSLPHIIRLSYQAEYMVEVMREGGCKPDRKVVELLLKAKDTLGKMFVKMSETCKGVLQSGELEIEVRSTCDMDELIASMESLAPQHIGSANAPMVEDKQPLTQSEYLQPNDEQPTFVCTQTEGLETAPISLLLEGVAADMVEDFILEVDEHSGIITDQLLIKLDSQPEDREALSDLFRRVHTLKGNTGLLLSVPIDDALQTVLKDVLSVLQQLEGLLAQVRDAKVPISGTIVNSCFEAIDALVSITAMLRKGFVATNDGRLKQLVGSMLALQDGVMLDKAESVLSIAPSTMTPTAGETSAKSADRSGVSTGHSIRVSGEKLDRLMNVIGELTITKNVFSQIARKLTLEHNLPHLSREVKDAGQFVNRISSELEDAIMAMRMTEVRLAFQRFPRIIRDIALQTGKNISLIMEGEDTELDKNIIEQIGDPLLHLVRNSGDHGIETMEERRAVGKDPQGNVWLRAYNRGNYVIIEVEDDGRGMNPESLKRQALVKGFITEQEAIELSDEQVFQLIFLPGFSTAKEVTEISGRGVGMDVVRSNIAVLHGTIKITSQLGKGSKITMQLPLTLMVSRGLVVEVQNQMLVMPLDNVLEIVKVSTEKLVMCHGKRILYHRGEVVGVVLLAEILRLPRRALPEYTSIVVVTDGHSKLALIVDKLLNEQDILVKPLPEYLSGISGMGGATIMGDGKVALVLNPVELVQSQLTRSKVT